MVVSNPAKLHISNSCMIVNQDNDEKVIPIEQINSLIIESQRVNLTSALMCKLVESGISVIFCDKRHNPLFETIPFHNNAYFSKNIDIQTRWSANNKENTWNDILREKITNQATTLKKLGFNEYEKLINIADSMTDYNYEAAEAQAARIYFQTLFGYDFCRRTENNINCMLNYGYSVILSTVNKSIIQHGYLTAIGIGHHSCTNPFNLTCDIMEPFRPYIDLYVYKHQKCDFDRTIRREIVALTIQNIIYRDTSTSLETAIDRYVMEIIEKLNR